MKNTPKGLNEELMKMRKLMDFDISENSHDVLSESNVEESILEEVDPDEDDPKKKTKGGFGFGFNKKGKQNLIQKMRGVNRGGAMGGLEVSWDKESNIKLDTTQDVLSKMNNEIGDSEGWTKLPTEVKEALAQGYFTVIEEGLDNLSDVLSKKEIKYYGFKKLKKFFKK